MTVKKYAIFKGKKYQLFLYNKKEWFERQKDTAKRGSKFWWFWMFFEKAAKKRGIKIRYPLWVAMRVAAMAYVFGIGTGFILMRDNVWFMKKMHIRHEIGHILGIGHCWVPECMNPTRFFRWCVRKSLWGKIEIVD
jgi:hypothetical protein